MSYDYPKGASIGVGSMDLLIGRSAIEKTNCTFNLILTDLLKLETDSH